MTVWRGIAFAGNVAEAQVDGVNPELDSHLVDRRFEGEERLGRARGPVCVGRRLVGRHLEAVEVVARDAVGAGQEARCQARVPAGAGAVVVGKASSKGKQRAVAQRAKLDVEKRRGGRVADDELVRAGEGEAHGTSHANGDQRQ